MKKVLQGRNGRGRTRPVIAGLLAAASVAGAVGVAAAAQGDVNDLRAVGPESSLNGYPIWYRDADGTEVELCLDGTPLCRFLPGDVPNPNSPIKFPENFPGEAFWWAGESVIADGLTEKVVLVMAAEAAFASGEVATPGDQVSFGRVRVRMDGMIPGATYHITHPYGEVDLEADDGGRVFSTEDIGALTTPADFSLALDSPIFGNLLQWDAGAPAGYLGDPSVDHTVTGSPTGFNKFKVEGPAGSFGPNQACPGVDDGSCVITDLFSIVGKHAQTSGVQTMRAAYVDATDPYTDYLEVFATSRPGQKIMLTGAGIGSTQMKGVTTGRGDLYYAKVLVSGNAPLEVKATNQTDGTSWTTKVTDLVTVTDARYDVSANMLTVAATSSKPNAVLTIPGGQIIANGTLNQIPMATPPLNIVVKSDAGGSDSEPVRLIGSDFQSVVVTAMATANPTTPIPTQVVALESTGSSGDIASYKWEQTAGTPVTLTGWDKDVATFVAPGADSELKFRLTTTGVNGSSTSQAEVTVTVAAGETPVANAGPDRTAIVDTNVTLDATASLYATTYQWTQTGGPAVTLNGANMSIASFEMPNSNTALTFTLKASAGAKYTTDTVVITKVNEVVTTSRVELRTRNGQLRVEGSTNLFTVPNVVSIYVSDGVAGTHPVKAIGTAIVDPTVGTFVFRVDSGVVLPANAKLDIFTSRGGVLENVAVTLKS
jgi:hypothetical protein